MEEVSESKESKIEWVWSIGDLSVINAKIREVTSKSQALVSENVELFKKIAENDETIKQLKGRAYDLFELEGVNSYPDPKGNGRLTLVAGRRYIPVEEAKKTLPEDLYNKLVRTGRAWVKWTPPKAEGSESSDSTKGTE